MPEPEPSPSVEPGETIARHCRTSNHIRRSIAKARFDLFLPAPDIELSVIRCTGIDDAAIRAIGQEHVGEPPKGHASVSVDVVSARGLRFVADGEPFARHASVVGWADPAKSRLDARAIAEASVLFEY